MINQRDIGAERMDIDLRTHWYIIKFLAHKLVFQDVIGKNTQPSLTLLQYTDVKGKTMSDIARHMEVPVENLELYNKWLNKKRVPEDRDYIVIIPAPTHKAGELMARMNSPEPMPAESEC
jgi:membrane-bound lytic murein transglycosylase D